MSERLRYIATLLGLKVRYETGFGIVELPPGVYFFNDEEIRFKSSDRRYEIVSKKGNTFAMFVGIPFNLSIGITFVVTELWGGFTDETGPLSRVIRRVIVDDPDDFLTVVKHSVEHGEQVDMILDKGSVTKEREPGFVIGNFDIGFVELTPTSIGYFESTDKKPIWKKEFGVGEIIGVVVITDNRAHFVLSSFGVKED